MGGSFMVETVAPGFVTPPRGVQVPPVVSIVGTGRPLSEGIQLHHNRDRYGFFLNKEIEGFGLAPFENTTQPRASGGATLRHRRYAEGSMRSEERRVGRGSRGCGGRGFARKSGSQ